jgi:multidrug/hemolysin transport system permease protein
MTVLISRHLKVFFRDKTSVFFSLLAVIIILALYLLFLGDVWAQDLVKAVGAKESTKALVSSWIMAGILAITSITTVMGAFGTIVDDRVNNIIKDFKSAPVSDTKVAYSYIFASFIIGLIMTLFTFVIAEIYIVISGGELLPFISMLKVFGIVALSSLCSTAMISLLVSFFKSQAAFGTASTVIGTLIGFLTGIYIPIGALPSAVQLAIKLFPIAHSAQLLRQIMIEPLGQQVFAGVPQAVVEEFQETMGITFRLGGEAIGASTSLLIISGATVLFFVLSALRFSKKSK